MKELLPVLELAKKFPNITGVYLDDFIVKGKVQPDGQMVGQPAMRADELMNAPEQMKAAGRPLKIWATLYPHEINPARKLIQMGVLDDGYVLHCFKIEYPNTC